MPLSGLTRRALLHWFLLIGIGLPTARRRAAADPPGRESNASLLNIMKHPERAAIVGEEYLRLRPDQNDERLLSESLGLTEARLATLDGSDLASVRDQVLRRHQQDFQSGEVVLFHGWILSATELRWCALVHLYSRS